MTGDSGIPVLTESNPDTVRAVLAEHGVAVVRAPGATLDEFTGLSEALITAMVHHATNTIERDPVDNDPRTSTVTKGTEGVPLHREGSYAPGCPDLLMFYCDRPASAGGETILCDGVELLRRLDSSIRTYVEDLDLYWSWAAPPERWQQMLGVRTTAECEVALDKLRGTLKPYEALEAHFEGERLHGRFRTGCVIPSAGSGLPSFCNSLLANAYQKRSDFHARDKFEVAVEDGSRFPADVLAEIKEVSDEVSFDLQWEPGDIAVVDNSRFMHGRREFDDPDRRILVRMGYLDQNS